MASAIKPRVVLLDIEGTVCPISFVKDVLFPYALTALHPTLEKEWSFPHFTPYITAFPAEYSTSPATLLAHVRDLMSRDVKAPYLKALQGYLWESGYASGALQAPLFEDVAPRIEKWKGKGKDGESGGSGGGEESTRVMIYSSGSVPAQKLLFGHTTDGNLSGYISDWFDTVNAGPKTERASYERIAGRYPEVEAGEWLFLSDNVKEVVAAKEAGMQSYVVERPGNAELSEEDRGAHRVVRSFDEI